MFNQHQVSGYYSITDPITGLCYYFFADPNTGRSYPIFKNSIIIRGYRIFKDPYTQEPVKVYVDQNQRILSPGQFIFDQYINGEPRIAYKIRVAPQRSRATRAHPTVFTQEGAPPIDATAQSATAAPAQAQASVGFTSQIKPQLSLSDVDDQTLFEMLYNSSWEK